VPKVTVHHALGVLSARHLSLKHIAWPEKQIAVYKSLVLHCAVRCDAWFLQCNRVRPSACVVLETRPTEWISIKFCLDCVHRKLSIDFVFISV
jgi:hypothetical protein